MDSARIAITGLGVVSPLGVGLDDFHRSLAAGRSGIATVDFPWETGYKTNRLGLVNDSCLSDFIKAGHAEGLGRTTSLAVVACRMALEQSGLDLGHNKNLGVVVGTAMGEALEIENGWAANASRPGVKTELARRHVAHQDLNGAVSAVLGIEGPSHLVATTCAAGNHAIGWACDLLKSEAVDAMLAVGADTVGYVDLLGFSRLLLQAPDCCRPFDLHRKGTILSEGAGALLLEPLTLAKRRRANILGELAGYGLSCDAAGAFAGKVTEVRTLQIAATAALNDARCNPDDIQYISAHGSGTHLNDVKETCFIKAILGDRAYQVPVSSIKSMLGHAQGAASSLEAVASVLSFHHNVLYPTINYETPDPDCDLDYVTNQARACRVDTIMSNAFGIGGNNAIVILRRWTG